MGEREQEIYSKGKKEWVKESKNIIEKKIYRMGERVHEKYRKRET